MKRTLLYLMCLAALLLTGCETHSKMPRHHHAPADTLTYASLLELEEEGEVTFCRIHNPWNLDQTLAAYLLLPSDTTLLSARDAARYEQQYEDYEPIYVPLRRVTLTAGCHAYLLWQLGALDRVAVVCDADYVSTPAVERALAEGLLLDGGNAAAPNAEVIMATQSDAAWVSPFENAGSGIFNQLPLPIIYCADYMETSPLARAEWMKFYGRLVGRTAQADSLFRCVERHYLSLRAAEEAQNTLTLLSETLTASTWYVPGGHSTLGQLYADAGADYYWRDDSHAGSLSLSPEAVLQRAQQCDVWLMKYYRPEGDLSLRDFAAQSPFYPQFRAVQSGQVYGCNTATSIYFDETPFRPDLLLFSVRRTLHPELSDTLLLPRDTLVKKSYVVRTDTVVDPGYFHRLR
jgi:iron complex transport system substrate-binding protein